MTGKDIVDSVKSSLRGAARDVAYGSIAGVVVAATTFPLDTIKVRIQARGNLHTGLFGCIGTIMRKEGLLAFYRGVTVPIVVQPLYIGATFGGLRLGLEMQRIIHSGNDEPTTVDFFSRYVLGGGMSGLVSALVACPGERVKVMLQAGTTEQASVGTFRALMQQPRPLATMFSGLTPTLLREIPGSIMWFYTFETVKRSLPEWIEGTKLRVAVAGLCSGATYWCLSFPFDSVKTHIQAAGGQISTAQATRLMYRNSGIMAFFGGIHVAVLRGALADCINWVTVTHCREIFDEKVP